MHYVNECYDVECRFSSCLSMFADRECFHFRVNTWCQERVCSSAYSFSESRRHTGLFYTHTRAHARTHTSKYSHLLSHHSLPIVVCDLIHFVAIHVNIILYFPVYVTEYCLKCDFALNVNTIVVCLQQHNSTHVPSHRSAVS